MIISCSAAKKIWEIPDSGAARVGGYWPGGNTVCQSSRVEWQNGKITSLMRWDEAIGVSSSKEVLNWQEYYLFPGWLDAHVHLALDSIDFYKCLENWQHNSLMEENIKDFLRHYMELGIVAIRDGGDLPGFAWLAKNKVESGEWQGPRILSVHEAVSKHGMYGRFLGRGFKDLGEWQEKRKLFFAQGMDQLKVIVTGLISFDIYDKVGPTQWSVEELREIVRNAHDQGIRVMAHASGEEGIQVAVAAGVDSIEHGYYMTTELLEGMLDKGIAWVPTVAPIGNLLKRANKRYSLAEKDVLKRILDGQLARIYEAYRLKVRLGVGTDAGAYLVPHGEALLDEMTWMAQAGIPTLEVRRLATAENAAIFGWQDFGTLQIGTPMNYLQLNDQLFVNS